MVAADIPREELGKSTILLPVKNRPIPKKKKALAAANAFCFESSWERSGLFIENLVPRSDLSGLCREECFG